MSVTLVLLSVLAAGPAESPAWHYVRPGPGEAFESPPLRAVPLSEQRPDDLSERVEYRGRRRRYAQLRYGSPGSTRVTVVVDELGPGAADLYVDADRNRRIEAKDKVEGRDRVWRLPLDVATADADATRHTPRAVLLRVGATGRTLGFAAAGYLAGRVRLNGRDHDARRTDGDADGTYAGPQDRVWIDLDDDGRWDSLNEQFLYAAVMNLGGDRVAVRSDPEGTRLQFDPLEGTGRLRLAVGRAEARARLTEVHALMVGKDGSALDLSGQGGEVVAPAGEYRVGALSVTLADPDGGRPWHFVFSDTGGRPERRWYKVRAGGACELDPLAGFDLEAEFPEPVEGRVRGSAVTVQPRLFSHDGLLINAGYRGTPADPGSDHQCTARVTLTSASSEVESDAAVSGFS